MENKRSHASFATQCIVLTKRSFVNMYRDLGYYWLRLAIYVVLAIGLGTLFYHVGSGYNSIEVIKRQIYINWTNYLNFYFFGYILAPY